MLLVLAALGVVGEIKEGVQKVFGTLDLFVSLLETEIKYPILQGGILPFWTPSLVLNAPLEALFLFL